MIITKHKTINFTREFARPIFVSFPIARITDIAIVIFTYSLATYTQ